MGEGKRHFPGTLSCTSPLERILSRDPGEDGPGGFCLVNRLGRILFRTPACERIQKELSVVSPEGVPRPIEGLLLDQARETTTTRPEVRRRLRP